jgi:hypothetical protein
MVTERNVSTPSTVQSTMVSGCDMVRTLVAGTGAMRAAGEKYLPKEPAEDKESYDCRVKRSTLFNATGKTVDDMTGKVFQKPVVLKDNVPAKLQEYAEDIDLTGRHINVFARDVFHDAMQTGICYILTDMPPALPAGSTLADEQKAGNRPYLVHIPLERLLGWKSETIGGVETLTQVRIRECIAEPDGEFHEKEIEQVRVIDAGTAKASGRWRTFRKNDKGEWVEAASGEYKLPKITLTAVYTNRTGFMTGSPVLSKLAELNVAHWQLDSDVRAITHFANVPILFYAGANEEHKLTIGAGTAIRNSDVNAKLTVVEHSGAAIGVAQKQLDKLEFQMQTMGLQLLIPQPGGKTATGEVRDDAKENSPLAMAARSLGDALEISLGFMAEYESLGADAGGEVDVNTDFGIRAGGADLQQLLDAVNAGQISKKTFWAEWQRRGVLSDSFDPDVEQELIDAQPPELDAGPGKGMNLGGGGQPTNDRMGWTGNEAADLFGIKQ